MESHSNGSTLFYQDILIPSGLNLDDVLHMAARVLEINLDLGVTSEDELRQSIQVALDNMEEDNLLEPMIEGNYLSATQLPPLEPNPSLSHLDDDFGTDMHWLHPNRIQHMRIHPSTTPPPQDDFWEAVPVRLTTIEFEKQVDILSMSHSNREKYGIEDTTCSICQEEIKCRQHFGILKCGHIYHKRCIKEWLVERCEQPTCPCCRNDVRVSKSIKITKSV